MVGAFVEAGLIKLLELEFALKEVVEESRLDHHLKGLHEVKELLSFLAVKWFEKGKAYIINS